MLVFVEVLNLMVLRIVPANADVVGLQNLAQLVADEVDDRLEVELGGHSFLDAVDDRELRRPLLGLLQEALRLVEEARVLERHAHARGDRAEQSHLGVAEGVLAFVVFERDRARARGRCREMGTLTR